MKRSALGGRVVAVLALWSAGCAGFAGDMSNPNRTPPDSGRTAQESGAGGSAPDAGVDAGAYPSADGGALDAGAYDAGATDAGAPDAGLGISDSGKPGDAGTATDAGSASGSFDAGPEPDLRVQFPPPGCATTEAHLLVHGVTRAGLGVTHVRVAQLEATSSDAFRTWQVDVPLATGANALPVEFVTATSGATAVTTLTVQRFASEDAMLRGSGQWAGRILGLAWDEAGQRVILADDVEDGVWGVEATTGDRAILSDSEGTTVGTGFEITQPRSGIVRGQHAYVIDDKVVVDIDLTTGNRAALMTAPDSLNDFALGPNRAEAVAGSLNLQAIVAVDLSTGAFRTLSSASVGQGPGPGSVGPLGVSAAHANGYFGLRYQDRLLAVDLSTGNRRVFSEATGGEPAFSDPEFIVVDDESDQAFVFDSKRIVAVDLSTGRRSLFGRGPLAWAVAVRSMAMTPYGLAVVDYVPSWETGPQREPTLFVADPLTGTRVLLSR